MEPSADDDLPASPTPPNPLPEGPGPVLPTPKMPQLDAATAAEREEVRRLVDAGATSPEDLRALAEKIRLQREREQEVWRSEVRPSLRKSKKHPFLLSDLKSEPDDDRSAQRRFLVIAGFGVLLVLLVLTLSSASVALILFLVAALLAYAYASGRQRPADEAEEGAGSPAPGEPDGEAGQ